MNYTILSKVFLTLPIIAGFLMLIELVLPTVAQQDYVIDKNISHGKFNMTNYNLVFNNNNDQFTPEIYNAVEKGDAVTLQTAYFTKEVNALKIDGNDLFLQNNTSEIYPRIGFGIGYLGLGIYFMKRKYFTNKQYRYIAFLCILALFALIRIIKMNL
jgi:hypothetical protein